MKIECLVAQGCPSLSSLKRNINKALEQEGIEAKVLIRVVEEEEARKMGIPGSPTVLVNGEDLEGLKTMEGTIS